MKKVLVLNAIVAAAIAIPFASSSNATPTDGPAGRKCAFNSSTDVTREAGWQTGQMNAGPMASTDGDGIMRCRIVVNQGGKHTGTTANDAQRTTSSNAGVAVIPPGPINYQATAADDVYLCTSWTWTSGARSGQTIYWYGAAATNPNGGAWDTDPNHPDPTKTCSVPLSIEPNDPECSIWHYIDGKAGTNIAEIWQDCEPYPTFDPCAFAGIPPESCPEPIKPSRKTRRPV